MGRYRDVDALAYQQRVEGDDDGVAANHVSKKRLKAAGKVAEVVFDPEGHKEFVTGFRKRKQQRRTKALKELQVKAKQERLQFRAEKRAKLKAELGIGDDWGVDSDGNEVDKPADAKLEAGQVKVYAGQGVTTTVTTLALDSGPESSESEQDEEADVHGGEEGAGHGGDGAEEGHADQGHGPGARRWGGRGQRGRGRGGAGGRHGHEREDSRGKTTRMLQKLTSKIQKGAKPFRKGKTASAKGSKKGGKGG